MDLARAINLVAFFRFFSILALKSIGSGQLEHFWDAVATGTSVNKKGRRESLPDKRFRNLIQIVD
ncbi:MAG TPA: hypothetical protein V6D10_21555 [Trichocoleus sp.]|jgi:hypothetical protein